MSLSVLIAIQAVAAAAGPSAPGPSADAAAPVPIDFDLARASRGAALPCGTSWGALIVVCGRRAASEGYPMAAMARRYEHGPLRAETDVGGATARAYAEQVDFGQGRVSNRAMVGIRMPF